MKRPFLLAGALAALALGSSDAFAVQEPDVTLEFIQTAHSSSVLPLMHVSVTNTSYTPLNLVDRGTTSQLLIDGKPSVRGDVPFPGPPGLPAMGRWEACMPVQDYSPAISPGKHRVVLKMGSASSNSVTVDWPVPINWRKGNMKSRLKEVREIASALKKGLPRNCVEEWLTTPDGGMQDSTQVRYFLEPQMKIVVPYAHAGGSGGNDEVVDGPAKVYEEQRLKD